MERTHRRKREDPLVAIDGARVRAAVEWKGLSVNGAAARMKVSQQTLDSIVRGKTKRCYESLRDQLAAMLGRPATWLGGEADLQPAFTPWLPLPELGYQPPLWVDENMRIVRPPEGGDLTQRTTLPPRYQLAAHDLSTEILKSWKRDIDRANADAQVALSRLAVGRWKKSPWDRAAMLITRLISAFWWRRSLLNPPEMPSAVDPKQLSDDDWKALSRKVRTEAEERAAEQLAADDAFAAAAALALTTVLRPWLTGDQQLNYKTFVDVLEWASAGFGKHPSPGGT
jgi:hypothetical protein